MLISPPSGPRNRKQGTTLHTFHADAEHCCEGMLFCTRRACLCFRYTRSSRALRRAASRATSAREAEIERPAGESPSANWRWCLALCFPVAGWRCCPALRISCHWSLDSVAPGTGKLKTPDRYYCLESYSSLGAPRGGFLGQGAATPIPLASPGGRPPAGASTALRAAGCCTCATVVAGQAIYLPAPAQYITNQRHSKTVPRATPSTPTDASNYPRTSYVAS